VVAASAGAALVVGVTACTPAQPLTFTGIGPLAVGMTEQQAVATGWLSTKTQPWCPLGFNPDPAYQLRGPSAPRSIEGKAIFHHGRLDTVTVTRGASTAQGIEPGFSTRFDLDRAYPDSSYDKVELHSPQHIVSVRPSGAPFPVQQQFLLDANTLVPRVQAVGVPYVPSCG